MLSHRHVPTAGFPRRELFRLLSMLMLLVIVGMLIVRTRNASMWRWAANLDEEDAQSAQSASKPEAAEGEDHSDRFVETLVTGPNDQQPFEQSQAEYQFQAITDKAPNSAEEMPTYWRLMRWSMTESFDDLWARANKDRYFTHLGQTPEKHRGELIAMNISLRRAMRHAPESKENSAGVQQVYEAWGVTDESRTGLYCLLFYDLPPQLPVKPSIQERAQFVGYFMKLISYEDALGKTRWAPLLIGRLRMRENSAQFAQRQKESEARALPWLLGGAVVLFAGLVVWTRRYLAASSVAGMEPVSTDHQAIEHWLETGGEEISAGQGGSGWEEFTEDETVPRPQFLPRFEPPPTSEDVPPTRPT